MTFAPGFFPGTRERYVTDADGKVARQVVQDAQGIVDGIAAARDIIKPRTAPGDGTWVGTVPIILAQTWAKECGAPIGTKEFNQYLMKKLLDGEFAKLRGVGRR